MLEKDAKPYQFRVRWPLEQDLEEIVRIEREAFGTWNANEFRRFLKARHSFGYVVTVRLRGESKSDENVIGFVMLTIVTGKGVHVENLAATWPEARRLLIDRAFQVAARHKTQLTW